MRCPGCGHQEVDGSAFCSMCGTRMEAPTDVMGPVRAAPAAPVVTDVVGRNCPYCRFPLKTAAEAVKCPSCGAVHHGDCWAENGGCAVLGCASAPVVFGPTGPAIPPVPPPPPGAGMAPPPSPPTLVSSTAWSAPPSGPPPRDGSGRWKVPVLVGMVLVALAGAVAAVVIATTGSDTRVITETQVAEAPAEDHAQAPTPPAEEQSSPAQPAETETTPAEPEPEPELESAPRPRRSSAATVNAMLKRHFRDLRDGNYERAYRDLASSATGAGHDSWVQAQREDGLLSFRLSTSTSASGDFATARIQEFHTEAAGSGCYDWTGSWQLARSGGRWRISKSNLTRHGGSCE